MYSNKSNSKVNYNDASLGNDEEHFANLSDFDSDFSQQRL